MVARFGRHVRQQYVGYMALFVALGGVSYAAIILPANSVGSKQIKRGAVKNSDLGKSAVTTGKVKDGSLLSIDFKPGQLMAGAPGAMGPQGPQGLKGDKGDSGTNGTNGTDGAAGPAGPFPDALPSGKTIRGEYAASGDRDTGEAPLAYGAVPFVFTLPAAPAAHYMTVGSTTANCPGIVGGLAQAAPGHACLYEAGSFGSPAVQLCSGNSCGLTFGRTGGWVRVAPSTDGTFGVRGYWAATAA